MSHSLVGVVSVDAGNGETRAGDEEAKESRYDEQRSYPGYERHFLCVGLEEVRHKGAHKCAYTSSRNGCKNSHDITRGGLEHCSFTIIVTE